MNRFYTVFFAVALAFASAIPVVGSARSFAVVVDRNSYEKCSESIDAYAACVREAGWDVFVAAADWLIPEQLRDSIRLWYNKKALAGAVFVGDIPIPMIRRAQFMTSAFKMSEEDFPVRESSVPSDRFYDDFDLKFDFVGRDSSDTRFFYYNLSADSAQEISCDIFTGRITPSYHYGDKYSELSSYMKKLVEVKKEKRNRLDKIDSYTGSGSFSDSMIAWKDETITITEQAPETAKTLDGAKYFVFYQYPYMKDIMLKECEKEDLDLILYHHHGTPDRQWIGNSPLPDNEDAYYSVAKMQARGLVRRQVRYGKSAKEAMDYVMGRFELDSCWVRDSFCPETERADSLEDAKTGILLDDVHNTKSNVRLLVFDACYNGDFRENDYIANRYIMGRGKSVAAIGNSVNVLQDKPSSTLMGMLSAGYSVGEWHQMSAILESHVIGDPTFAFESSYKFKRPEIDNNSIIYWKKFLSKKYPCDIQGLALYKLYKLKYSKMKTLLVETYRSSPYYMLRLNALELLRRYSGGEYGEILREALDDPYEYIRRKACYRLSLRGEADDVQAVVDAYFRDYNAKRVNFNIINNSAAFPDDSFLQSYRRTLENVGFPYRKEDFPENGIQSAMRLRNYTLEGIERHGNDERGRRSIMAFLRNAQYPQFAEKLINIVKDDTEPLQIRINTTEILGWYTMAYNRADIVRELGSFLHESGAEQDAALNAEIRKTINRLNVYLR